MFLCSWPWTNLFTKILVVDRYAWPPVPNFRMMNRRNKRQAYVQVNSVDQDENVIPDLPPNKEARRSAEETDADRFDRFDSIEVKKLK